MILYVRPASLLRGSINLPASKSYSIRAFIIASCGGLSKIIKPSNCDDARVALNIAQKLGSEIHCPERNVWVVKARGKQKIFFSVFNVGESGTVLRFLLPLLAVHGISAKVAGEGTLKGRPNFFLTQTLKKMGVDIRGQGSQESIPLCIRGGNIHGGRIEIDGSLSSQFISALFIACPLLLEDTRLIIKGKIVSRDYIFMTQQILQKAGVKVKQLSSSSFYIKGGQKFKGLRNFTVPSDYGLAAFFLVAATLVPSRLTLKGLLKDELPQADGHILNFLKKMGVNFRKTNQAITIKGPAQLKGGVFSLKNCPDLVPIMSIVALFAHGRSILCDIGHARVKESDRISDLRNELLKIGACIHEKNNSLIIDPLPAYKKNILLNPHHDHRLAMAFCILGLKLGVKVKDMGCVNKSYPEFVKDFKSIGVTAGRI